MAKTIVTVDGVAYDMPTVEDLTIADFQVLKRIADVTTAEVASALQRGDETVLGALAIIAVKHSGNPININSWIEQRHTITFEEVADPTEGPAETAPAPANPTPADSGPQS